MHARLVIFKVDPQMRSSIQKLVEPFDQLYRAQRGFKQVYIIGDEASGEYGSFSVWQSKADAEAANAVIAPQLQQALSGMLQGPPSRWFLEVLEPNSLNTTDDSLAPS